MRDNPDQPVLVVNADDLGLSESATAGILRAHEHGIVTSASLAVTTAAGEKAARELPGYPRLGVGLHFCLTAGRPVAEPGDIPDLVNGDGFMRWRFLSLLLALNGGARGRLLAQISVELEAQITRAKSFGLTLDHINGERHIHLLPGVFELVAQAVHHHGIPHVRLINDVGDRYVSAAGKLRAAFDGGWVKVSLLSRLSRRARRVAPLDGPQHVKYATLLRTGRMYQILPSIWADPPSGVTEVAVHPGLPEIESSATGNPALSRYLASSERRLEAEACETLDPTETPARLATFGEVYDADRPLQGAEDRLRARRRTS
jgi:predicted glycoside hydrolase/deacetylase ChbG (UPF0249 family)